MSSPTDAAWVTIALLGKTRGNRGEITALPLSSKSERFQALQEVFLWFPATAGTPERFPVESTWFHMDTLIFKFRGIDTISDAEKLSGAEVRVPLSQRAALEEGEFYQSDLVGCELVDRAGKLLGRVTGWQDAGGAGLLMVDDDWLVPFARGICVEIDPAARRITVELPEGLKDLNRT